MRIAQYIINDWFILQSNRDIPGCSDCKKFSVIEVTVTLKRAVESILIVNFMPSLLLNIINQASVYLKGENKYDLIITVNITIMMVLTSIYLSISTSLPSTPDIKPIEIWLLFNLMYPFFILILSTFRQVTGFRLLQGLTRLILRPPTPSHHHHPQLSIKLKPVYTSPTSTYDTFLESPGQDLSNPAYIGLISGAILIFNPTPINRVKNTISNTYRLAYKCHTFLEMSGQGLHT